MVIHNAELKAFRLGKVEVKDLGLMLLQLFYKHGKEKAQYHKRLQEKLVQHWHRDYKKNITGCLIGLKEKLVQHWHRDYKKNITSMSDLHRGSAIKSSY
uniref:Uncharacterized protein n=1 Tax=Heliothis virescens TaxID=7102 RepID=A0A2A4J5N9_HELVI